MEKPPLIDGQSEIGRRPKKIGPQNALKRSKMGSKPRKSPPQAGKFWDYGETSPLIDGQSELRGGGFSQGIPLISKL